MRLIHLLFLLILNSCLDIPCETEYEDICKSPDGKFKIISSSTDCGATTTPSYGYKVIEINENNYDKNIENTFLGSSFGRNITWNSNDTIVVIGKTIEEYFTRKNELVVSGKKIIIKYH